MKPDKKFPLFIVSGASGVGKSTMCEILFKKETDYIVLESDILWQEVFNTPQDNYRNFREVWMTMCANVSQIGMPVVLCGCGIPEQFEICDAREYFTQIHYLAVVCETPILEKRMREGRGIQEEDWIRSSVSFNLWLRENASKTQPQITLLDNTNLTPEEAAEEADKWIRKQGGNLGYIFLTVGNGKFIQADFIGIPLKLPAFFPGKGQHPAIECGEACPSCPHRKRAGKARQVFCKYH